MNCNEGIVRERTNTGYSDYNAVQLEFRSTNLFNQFTSRIGYTFSKTTDNVTEIFGTLAGGNTLAFSQDPFNHPNFESVDPFPDDAGLRDYYNGFADPRLIPGSNRSIRFGLKITF